MRAFRALSIRGKLIVLLLLTSGSALFLSATGFAVNDLWSFREAMFDRLRAQADILGANSMAAVMFEDPDAARNTLESLRNESSFVAAAVYKSGGSLFAAFEREAGSAPPTLPSAPEGVIGADAYVHTTMNLGDELIGHVFVRMEFSDWTRRQFQHMVIAAGVMGVSLLVVVVLSSRLQKIISEPILRLAETARRVSDEKNYELRAEKLSGDEIGDLVDDFNGMLEQIQERDQRLLNHRAELEEEVRTRTSELVEMASQLEHQAFHDSLTGLANRSLFDDHLADAIARCERDGRGLAVMFLDLDRFKVINDTLGHAIGDQLLVQVATRFQQRLRRSDTIARLGGDEFAVLLYDLKNPEYAGDVAAKLIEAMEQPFRIEGYSLHLTTSVGISLYPADGQTVESILKNADTAMYRAKDMGRNRFKFFSPEMNTRALRRLSLENRLRRAVQEEALEVWYQPRCDAVSRKLVSLEALVRWNDPQEGLIMPGDFIPMAEDCGLIGVIDEWVLFAACAQMLEWYGGDRPPIGLSVNLSPSHFVRENFPEVVERILRHSGFPPDRLELEITEHVVGPAYADATGMLKQFKARGIRLSIDDFGIGYSSLSRLKQLPIDTLKIDRSFVRDLDLDPNDEAITRTIIAMAHSLNLKVVAEGVENESQYHFVRSHGCNEVQGYLFGRPAPASQIRDLLADRDRPVAREKA